VDKQMTIDIGIDANTREEIANGLSRVLADTYTLYLKTHNARRAVGHGLRLVTHPPATARGLFHRA
jgi:hypothetical protein